MKRIIIFGGTFDPIHNGHLRIADYASKKLNSKVIFLPNKSPRWKNPTVDIKHRVDMLKLAIKNYDNFIVSTYEAKLNNKINYTIDTIKYFINKYKGYEIYFLIGEDQVNQFQKWKNPDQLSKLIKILCVPRPEYKLDKNNIKKYNMTILKYDKSGDVSSDKIRTLHSLDTPYEVILYIEKHNLYYINELKVNYYKPDRFKHVLSVAHLAYEIASKNNIDKERAYVAGLLHDVGKKITISEEDEIMKKYYRQYYGKMNQKIYHQFVAEKILQSKFNIFDKEIIDAIKYHTTGKKNMSKLSKLIYASDKIDPLRGYDSKEYIEACIKDIDKGFIKVLKANYMFFKSKDVNYSNILTKECFKYYLGEKYERK